MSELPAVIQRVIQLTYEIEQTYGFGKSYSVGMMKVGRYSPSEWEAKQRQDMEWRDTARKWAQVRNPLIAEAQALVLQHRAEFTELAELVERCPWTAPQVSGAAWAEIRQVALVVADRLQAVDVTEGNHERDSSPIPKRPSENAFKAWRLRDLTGLQTQRQIAERMSAELNRTVHQGEVSRWLDEVDQYMKAGGVFPELPHPPGRPQPVDPAVLEMGNRVDRRTARQRQRRTTDPHAE